MTFPRPLLLFALACLAAALFVHPAAADLAQLEGEAVDATAEISLGYRGISTTGNAHRAREYDRLEPSPTAEFRVFRSPENFHFDLEGRYLNEDDFFAETHFDRESKIRFGLSIERFFHNLDHIPYDNGVRGTPPDRTMVAMPAEGSRPDGRFPTEGAFRTYYTDHDPGADYGVEFETSQVEARFKIPRFPAHLNFAFWRYEKQGENQLRFLDENCTGCHMQSRSRTMDRVTNEFRAGADAHLGYVDVAMEGLYREFREREALPSDTFGSHFRGREAGVYAHDEIPDTRLTEMTFTANTSLSGGLVGAASFTIGERENRSDISSVRPVKAETDYYKTTADVTYTPGEHWTVNFRYRMLDLDSSNSDRLTTYDNTNPNPLPVREAIDLERAWYEARVNYRPVRPLTLKAELRREEIERSETGPAVAHHSSATDPVEINPNWQLPGKETRTQIKIGFNSRLLPQSALRLNGWAAVRQNDDPAYGTTIEEGEQFFLGLNYTPANWWGLNASFDMQTENNDLDVKQFDDAETSDIKVFDLARERRRQVVSLGTWATPMNSLTFDLNYGYLRTRIEQDILFGAQPNSDNPLMDYTIEARDVDYDQTVQTLSAGVSWKPLAHLDCRVEGYHIRSEAEYDPEFATRSFEYLSGEDIIPGTASSSSLAEISRIDIRQNGLRGRLSWAFRPNWTAGLVATYDDYEDDDDIFDGSVQTYMASLTHNW